MSNYSINISSEQNLPPSQVGNGETTTDYDVEVVFTRIMLTDDLTPQYLDPENDEALLLKVLSLPNNGVLYLNDNLVNSNQTILFSDIDSGLFTYKPNSERIDSYSDNFNFQIADEGSQIFIG